ncbi:hypothetical protein ACJJTC_003946 [Scirpophaga incertulas]
MEEIMKALSNIQKELEEQKLTIQKSGEQVTAKVTQNIDSIIDEKFRILEEKYDNLQENKAKKNKQQQHDPNIRIRRANNATEGVTKQTMLNYFTNKNTTNKNA